MRVPLLGQPQGLPPGALAIYDFLDGSGDTLTDRSGNGQHGQLGSTAGADTNDPDWDASGFLSFTAADAEYVTWGDDADFDMDTQDFTVYFLYRPTGSLTASAIIDKRGTGALGTIAGWGIRQNTSGHALFNLDDTSGNGGASSGFNGTPVVFTLDTWGFHGFTFDRDTNLFMYKNGAFSNVAVSTAVVSAASGSITTARELTLMKISNAATYTSGDLAWLGIWKGQAHNAQQQRQVYRYVRGQVASRGIVV